MLARAILRERGENEIRNLGVIDHTALEYAELDPKVQESNRRKCRVAKHSSLVRTAGECDSGERGGATVISAAIIVVIISLILGLMALGKAVSTKHAVQDAADAAALAGAYELALSGSTKACSKARDVSMFNKVELESCEVEGMFLTLTATEQLEFGFPWLHWGFQVKAQARAGPSR